MSGLAFLSAEYSAMKRRVAEAEDRARRAEEEIDSILGFIVDAIVHRKTGSAEWLNTVAQVHAEEIDRRIRAGVRAIAARGDIHRCEHCDGGVDGAVKVACDEIAASGKHPGLLKAVTCPHCKRMTRV